MPDFDVLKTVQSAMRVVLFVQKNVSATCVGSFTQFKVLYVRLFFQKHTYKYKCKLINKFVMIFYLFFDKFKRMFEKTLNVIFCY